MAEKEGYESLQKWQRDVHNTVAVGRNFSISTIAHSFHPPTMFFEKWGRKGFLVSARLHSTQFITLHLVWGQRYPFSVLNIQGCRDEVQFKVREQGIEWLLGRQQWCLNLQSYKAVKLSGGRDYLFVKSFKRKVCFLVQILAATSTHKVVSKHTIGHAWNHLTTTRDTV